MEAPQTSLLGSRQPNVSPARRSSRGVAVTTAPATSSTVSAWICCFCFSPPGERGAEISITSPPSAEIGLFSRHGARSRRPARRAGARQLRMSSLLFGGGRIRRLLVPRWNTGLFNPACPLRTRHAGSAVRSRAGLRSGRATAPEVPSVRTRTFLLYLREAHPRQWFCWPRYVLNWWHRGVHITRPRRHQRQARCCATGRAGHKLTCRTAEETPTCGAVRVLRSFLPRYQHPTCPKHHHYGKVKIASRTRTTASSRALPDACQADASPTEHVAGQRTPRTSTDPARRRRRCWARWTTPASGQPPHRCR